MVLGGEVSGVLKGGLRGLEGGRSPGFRRGGVSGVWRKEGHVSRVFSWTGGDWGRPIKGNSGELGGELRGTAGD